MENQKFMRDRDIEKGEINSIAQLYSVPIREKAFFTVMRQSGLKPHIIKKLRIKDVERILEPDTAKPCRISISRQKHPSFIGYEAINYLKQYLETRRKREPLTEESLLFTARSNPNKEVNTKNVSRTFKQAIRKLDLSNELQLSSLTKFYRKNAKEYLTELDNSAPKDDEWCRELYEKKAMPSLEIELPTPIEMHRMKKQQRELENKLKKIEELFPKETPEQLIGMKKLVKENEEFLEYLEEHPEEVKRWEEERKKQEEKEKKWRKEHPQEAKLTDEQTEREMEEAAEHDDELYREHLEGELKEVKERIRKIEDIIRQPRERTVR